ncbi:GCN5-related N-acetyltransferase [Methanosarcina siciliae C2J]|uniref:GCN5-related N-acetyltransferase n=1 Tax=Methanosarcina siciliae C2J TaxID=1434118 RepID=A0A0E3LC66_9EURY|nr:N-acetyltransferase [Methanosarcina siciliae]AKB34986.1 GCN5-related N-acetyltransferase [Methanosarcina siciliae C2J]
MKTSGKKPKFVPELSLDLVAVRPEFRKRGIGGTLIREGLVACLLPGYDSVVIVLGHPEYYPKFGFEPAVKWRIKEPLGAPADAFMVLELREGDLKRCRRDCGVS